MSEANSGSNVAAGDGAQTAAERAELERLRAEVSELRGRPAAPPRRRRPGWRAPIATVLVALGCLLAPLSVIAVWSANQVADTSRYVANVAPLVHEPAVQNALTDKISTQITSRLDVTGTANQAAADLTARGLPRAGTLLKNFSGPLASTVDSFIHSQVHRIVVSPRFARAWVQVNTVSHAEIVKALSGSGGGAVKVTNGQVTVSLAPFIDIAKQDLSARGLTIVNKVPPINPTLALFSAKYLVKAQTAYRLINDLKVVLPIVALLLIGLGIFLARSHRRAVIGAGLGLAASMIVLAAGLLIFRGIYLNSVPNSTLPSDAAAVLFDTFVRFIKDGLRLLLVVGLVVAAAAFLTGPSVTAVRSRRAFAGGLGWLRERGELAGLRTGPAGTWTYAHRTGLRIGATALAALIFVFWGRPTVGVVIGIVIVLLVVLGLIELIGRPPAPHHPAAAGSG
jgi:hypothetical protein